MARRRHRTKRRNPSPAGHWGAKIGGFFFGGVIPAAFSGLVLGPAPYLPEPLAFDPMNQNATALAAYQEAMSRRSRIMQAIDVVAAIGAFLGTYRVKDPTAQAFLVGASGGSLVRAAAAAVIVSSDWSGVARV